jgi:hypothetical protein
MNNMSRTVSDPWLLNPDGTADPFASNVDWNMPDLPDLDEDINDQDPVLASQEGLDPEIVETPPVEELPPPPPPEPEGPETMDLEDGTQLVLSKDKGVWVGSVVGRAGNAQVYKGATKDKLILEILKAQANATKKIREQNAKIKFGSIPAKAAPAPQPQQSAPVRQLTADEIFEYKTLWESDPVAANDFMLQKTRGITMDQVLTLAQQGAQKGSYAANQLTAEQANKTFLANNPDYYPDNQNSQNHRQLLRWIAKFKLGEVVSLENAFNIADKLISEGVYTAENLEEAFQDLNNDGLMIQAPRQPKTPSPETVEPPPPVAVQHEPAPAPRPDSRIVSQVTRPRAALGIGRNDVTPVKPPESPNAPSAEDFENMTDEEVANTLNAIRRARAQSRR